MHRSGILVATLFALNAPVVSAQELTLVGSEDALDEAPHLTSMIAVLDEDFVRNQLSVAHEMSFRMEGEIDRLELEIAEAKAAVEVKKSEIEIIETRKDLADDQDRDAEKRALEREKDYEEAMKRLLERTVELHERELEHVRAQRETADRMATVHERELELIGAREEMASANVRSMTMERALRVEREVMSLERELLEAMRERAEKTRQEAEKERRVYEGQLRVLDARRELGEVER